MIDLKSRQRILDEKRTKMMVTELSSAFSKALDRKEEKVDNNGVIDTNKIKWLGIKEEQDPRLIELVAKLGKGLVVLYNTLKEQRVEIPETFPVQGNIEVNNLNDLSKYFDSLEKRIAQLATAISYVGKSKPFEIKLPKTLDISNTSSKDVLEALQRVEEAIYKLSKKESEFPDTVNIGNFPPQMVPQPVTHININALIGYSHTTSTTVSTTLTQLPGYGVLQNRRSLLIYNNSGSTTVFIGGSDVTASNGLPIVPETFSPVIDAGINMIIYGITSSGTADCRVMELSDESSGR